MWVVVSMHGTGNYLRLDGSVRLKLSVADFKALSCQVTQKFIKCRNVKTPAVSAIEATRC